jgi:hypothetical protein
LAAHALTAPMAPVIALMALAALGLSGDPVHKPVHEQEAFARPSERLNAPGSRGSGAFNGSRLWPSGLLLSHGLAVRAQPVAQVDPFAGGADGAAAARGGELDQAGVLLAGRCAPWRPGQVQGLRRLLRTAWGRRDHGLRLGACGLRLAAVIHCPPLFPPGLLACPPAMSSTVIPCVSRKDTSSQLPAAPSPRIRAADVTQAGAAPGPGGVIECLTVRSDLRGSRS